MAGAKREEEVPNPRDGMGEGVGYPPIPPNPALAKGLIGCSSDMAAPGPPDASIAVICPGNTAGGAAAIAVGKRPACCCMEL